MRITTYFKSIVAAGLAVFLLSGCSSGSTATGLGLDVGGFWWAAVPRDEWPDVPSFQESLEERWHPEVGDCRQELVFIGIGMATAGNFFTDHKHTFGLVAGTLIAVFGMHFWGLRGSLIITGAGLFIHFVQKLVNFIKNWQLILTSSFCLLTSIRQWIRYSSGNRKIQIRSTMCQYRPTMSTGTLYSGLKAPAMALPSTQVMQPMPMITCRACRPVAQ